MSPNSGTISSRAAAVVLPGDLDAARTALRALLIKAQLRIHFQKESDASRRRILSALVGTEARVLVYAATTSNPRTGRELCLTAQMLILKQDDSLIHSDRQLLHRLTSNAGDARQLRYEHRRPSAEPLL